MTRPLHSRLLSLVLSLWLTLFLSESEWVVRCPAHGGGAAGMQRTHAGHGVANADAGSHGVGNPDAATHARDVTAPAPGHDAPRHHCSCAGPGCCAPMVAALPGHALPMAHVVAAHEKRAFGTLERLASRTEYLLPPATAPPAAGLAHAA